ncbi:hypothetical protein BaRGS_00010917 [Batillaria attramentaria]|uniref:Glycosyltransferase n=1 Tax=Batillaria attramentaria TaxID=370345 RepID=A0ABD0LEC7_9CAEN
MKIDVTTSWAFDVNKELFNGMTVVDLCDPARIFIGKQWATGWVLVDTALREPGPFKRLLTAQKSRSRESSQSTAEIAYEWVKRDSPPAMYDYNDTCLARVVASKCHTDHAIPKLVHFVNFRRRELPFYSFVSIVSAFRVVQPCLILFHADYLPYGNHWELLVQMVPEVIHVLRKAPNSIFGRPVHVVEHQSDVARLEAMSKFGGIYSDFDYVLLNPLDDLLHHNVVMGMESGRFGNGFYMGQPGATFFKYWYDSYHTFNDGDWAGHSCAVPYEIFKKHPNLVHVVNTFHEPNWSIIHTDFYTKPFNWTKVYGIHLYSKLFSGILNRKLETLKSSVGEITRYTLFGNSQACLNKTH